MLVIQRRTGESVVIYTTDGPIEIKLCRTSDNRAKLGFRAPSAVRIRRDEHLTREELQEVRNAAGNADH